MSDAHSPQPPLAAHREKKQDRGAHLISNALAVAGFAILIIIIVWGFLHIASLSSGYLSTLFSSKPSTTLRVTAPASAASNRATLISWTYAKTTDGRFAFSYECANGVEFGVPIIKQGAREATLARVPCGQAFGLGNATSSLVVVPVLANASSTTATVSILFIPSVGSGEVRGSASMTITPQSATPAPTPTAHETAPQRAAPRSTGSADLNVSILSASTDANGESVVTFDIANDGASASGPYRFSAQLPTAQPYTFISDPQASLESGSHIVNTLRFTQSVTGTFTVYADSTNAVREINKNNNIASVQITAPAPLYDTSVPTTYTTSYTYPNNYTTYSYPTTYTAYQQQYPTYTPSGYPVYTY